MYKRILSTVILLILFSNSAYSSEPDKVEVLFIGNSLTYVGNLPAVFEAYSRTNGIDLSADMVAIGGFSLHEHLEQKYLHEALSQKDYDFVVFQERGGDLSCELNKVLCERSTNALAELVQISNNNGATPVLLGTYQLDLLASYEIEESESNAAINVSINYIPVSNHLYRARKLFPSFEWLDKDGGHPGSALTLLYSSLLNDALIEKSRLADSFAVNARIYGVNCTFKPVVVSAMDSRLPCGETGISYSSAILDAVSELLRGVDEQS